MKSNCDKTECWAHLDWHCEHAGILRVFAPGKQAWVDEYENALPFVAVDENTIEFVGLTKKITPSQWRAVRSACKAAGLKMVFKRIKNGVERKREVR